MSGVVLAGILTATAVWFIAAPGRIRPVLGFVLLGHAVNVLLLLAATGGGSDPPIIGLADDPVDPLPQAFVLTAIVISFGVTALLLALSAALHRDGDRETDPDRDEHHIAPGDAQQSGGSRPRSGGRQ